MFKGVIKFVEEVKQEIAKVTWSTRKETVISTVMVLVAVMIVALFFLVVDAAIFKSVQLVLGI